VPSKSEGLQFAIAALQLPRGGDGRITLAVDVSPWAAPRRADQRGTTVLSRPRPRQESARMIPGWPYSVIRRVEPGRTSWTAVLDAVRLTPDDDDTAVTARRSVRSSGDSARPGTSRTADPDVLLVFDSGYDVTRLAFLLADLPVQLFGSVAFGPGAAVPAPPPGRTGGRPGTARSSHSPEPAVVTTSDNSRYGTAHTATWDDCTPGCPTAARGPINQGPPPIIEGTVIRLTVDHLPGYRHPTPVWLWCSETRLTPNRCLRFPPYSGQLVPPYSE